MAIVDSVMGSRAGVESGSGYAQLSARVKEAGLLDRRSGYYTVKIAGTLLAFVGGWVAFALIGSSWWQLGTAAVMAALSTQVAFLGHDAGHKQIFRTRRANYLLGLALGNLGVGLSYGWWIDKHSRHHAHPNEVGKDPDVNSGVLVFTERQAQLRGAAGRRWSRLQAYLFFPLLLLEAMNLHVSSVRALAGSTVKSRAYRTLEIALFTVHVVGYLTIVFLVLPPWQGIAFIAVHQALFGVYMGCSFAPNHKGMPAPTDGDDLDYLRRQVLTSRNVRGGRLVDFLLGGLNYQIEHHLFPSMPRPNLRRAQRVIRQFCAEQRVSYAETGLFASYGQVLRHLHEVGRSDLAATPVTQA
ncbi:acyl-CoA desaturase [Rugosimonospora acidiphila]|uniref:Acyl-CoA desaturase n=1 Tax=Rugosimonospora acidiphila TaxID=556531 RepID=A0ABP9RUD2_9ACTN